MIEFIRSNDDDDDDDPLFKNGFNRYFIILYTLKNSLIIHEKKIQLAIIKTKTSSNLISV